MRQAKKSMLRVSILLYKCLEACMGGGGGKGMAKAGGKGSNEEGDNMAKFEEHGDENEDGAKEGGKSKKGGGKANRPPPVGKSAWGSKLGAQVGGMGGDVWPKVRKEEKLE